VHARHETHVGLHPTHDLSHVDLHRWPGQTQAAILSAGCADVALKPESMCHLDEMVLLNPIALGDLCNRGQPVPLNSEVHQKSQREIGISG
jgi:hypothetical protein